jgi:hypothetical protein
MGARDAIAKLISGGIRAFHSSPHDFERFDLSKIGTGEGAQVYGHGLYFAENPAVSGQGGQYWKSFLGRFGPQEQVAAKYLSAAGQDHDRARQMLMEGIKRDSAEAGYLDSAYHRDDLAAVKLLESKGLVGPRTYEVNINADPAQMLDWDKPLNQQPVVMSRMPSSMLDAAQKEAQSRAYAATTKKRSDQLWDIAKDPYRAPGEFFGGGVYNAEKAAKQMTEAGIPGVKYLDEGSRGIPQEIERYRTQLADPAMAPHYDQIQKNLATWEAKPVTSNYVVSDPGINIDILRKYGIAGAAAAPVVGSAMGDTYDQSQYEAAP